MSTENRKVAFITGGSRGIGKAIALRLAKDGLDVAVTYTSSPEKAQQTVAEIEAAGGKAIAIQADSADAESVKKAVAETAAAFGKIDVLVNNAGVLTLAPIDEFKLEDFDRAFAVNVRGVFVAVQETIKHMGQGGRIITIGSVNSDYMPFPTGSIYALTKGAVASFTRGLARDLGPRGITVNNIQPGPVDTDMNPADGPMAANLVSQIAVGRYGHGSEIAAMVAYLISPEAAYVTGASIKIDGGFTA